MDEKTWFPHRTREVTNYVSLQNQMRNLEELGSSLSKGSKNRLFQYAKNLSVTRGKYDRNLDKDVMSMVKKYAQNPAAVNGEIEYLMNLVCKDGVPFSRNLKIYSTTEEAMARFADKDYTSFRWNRNYRKSLEQLKSIFRLKLKPLVYHSDEDIRNALPKVDTHSGWTYIETGLKEKGKNISGSYKTFQRFKQSAIQEGSFRKPILIGFRTQASGEYEDDGSRTGTGKHKLRVVSMVDMYVIIAELMFAKPIQNFMATQNFYAGGKDETEISSIITNWRVNNRRFLSIDYSSFDQTISSWLIEDAFSVIREAFVMYPWQEKLFDVIVHDFIHKDFVLSEGILHSDKGVPSGSMFTQIIDTLVNWLVVNTYFNSINEKCEMIIMGDDNAIFTKAQVDIEHLASYIIKNFGLIIKTDDKSNEGECRKDDVKFLSRYWTFDGQWRHPNQLISRLLFPERKRIYDNEIGPQHVIFAFILTYRKGMEQFLDTRRFMHDYPISKKYVLNQVDSRYLPGALAYIKEYTLRATG